jgi:hypothetical protein
MWHKIERTKAKMPKTMKWKNHINIGRERDTNRGKGKEGGARTQNKQITYPDLTPELYGYTTDT